MEPIHHRAVVATWDAQADEADEYRPFSGYGGSGGYFAVCAPFRGTSTIPHHEAVESHEDGERNGRVFYGPRPGQIAQRAIERQRPRPVFRMDARHAALEDTITTTTSAVVLRLPDVSGAPGARVIRVRPGEAASTRSGELVGAPS
jgi:hypothetical protein